MAVSAAPSVTLFVRMKLRIIGNVLGGDGRMRLTFIGSCVFGVIFAAIGALSFLGLAAASPRRALAATGLIGGVIVLGWLLLPTLYFGVDETLDPARFALLPLSKRRIAAGMAAAALVGIPPFATSVVFLGAAISATIRGGAAAGLAALLGVALTLIVCITGSRALTSALAGALRSRRIRDIGTVVVALIAVSFGPLQIVASHLLFARDVTPVLRVVRIIGWTPLAAGFVAPYDVIDGHPLIAAARLGVLAATVPLLVWLWSATFEGAMVGTVSAGRAAGRVTRGGAVASLIPRWLRGPHVGAFQAIVTRELRYWIRDNRRRIALISAALSGITLPLIWALQSQQFGGRGLTYSSSFSAWIAGLTMFQIFSMDGTAYASHLLAGVPARIDVRARVTAWSIVMLPILAVLGAGIAMLRGSPSQLPEAYGTMLATFGVAVGASISLAVDGAFPMPDSRNPFAMRTGSGSGKSLMMLAVMGATVTGSVPLYIAVYVLPVWVALPLGAAWCVAALYLGTTIAARRLDGRGPEMLLAVTPRR
ncbi:MAG TPA: ABC transporter permease [Micromonosporaceae bacterium]